MERQMTDACDASMLITPAALGHYAEQLTVHSDQLTALAGRFPALRLTLQQAGHQAIPAALAQFMAACADSARSTAGSFAHSADAVLHTSADVVVGDDYSAARYRSHPSEK
jgi:hypothetical protein